MAYNVDEGKRSLAYTACAAKARFRFYLVHYGLTHFCIFEHSQPIAMNLGGRVNGPKLDVEQPQQTTDMEDYFNDNRRASGNDFTWLLLWRLIDYGKTVT